MKHLTKLSIEEVAQRIKKGEITPVDLVKACFERIEEVDDQIIAWTVTDKRSALDRAEELTVEARNGQIRSVFHGIPIGIKDIIDVKGLPTRYGCKVWEEATAAEKDASIVSKLRELGAIILGKTHTAELAYFDPAPTRNPYNLAHTPGGSSSGSAAAVAANMVPFSIGTQTNASIARPAAYSGVGGFRPTMNKLSLQGILSFSTSFDSLGFFGKRFKDASLGYVTIEEDIDPSVDFKYSNERSLHIGIVTDPIYDEATDAIKNAMNKVTSQLKEADHKLEVAIPPCSFAKMIQTHTLIMAYEAALEHKTLVEEHESLLGEKFCGLIKVGQEISKEDYEVALRSIQDDKEQMQEFFAKYDLLLAPPADSTAPEGLDTTGNPKFTTPWTVIGGPLAVLPVEVDQKGLPIGVMFASAPGTDLNLIKSCIHLETQILVASGKGIDDPLCE